VVGEVVERVRREIGEMKKSEIISELVTLLDYVNDDGKSRLRRLLAHAHALPEEVEAVPEPEPAPLPEPEPEPEPKKRGGKKRDPGEAEQAEARKRKLPVI